MKLLDQVRQAIRTVHYSIRTERCYVYWIERFIRFHQLKHPSTMGAIEVEQFLTHLAVADRVSASTRINRSAHCCFSINVCSESNLAGSTPCRVMSPLDALSD